MWAVLPSMNKKSTDEGAWLVGAEDEVRTRDLNLGKVALYQLSYFCVTLFSNGDANVESSGIGRKSRPEIFYINSFT